MNLMLSLSGIVVIVVEINYVASQTSSRATNATAPWDIRRKRAAAGCNDIQWKPELDLDGSYAAVQCKGEEESGRCFCYSPNGSKLFGWSWWSSAKKMNCRCSRQRHRLSSVLERNDVSLHCTKNGNYERLQCDNGLCWCVEPTTGKPKERLYPQLMMKYLPCYGKNDTEIEDDEEEEKEEEEEQEVPSWHYLRHCESKSLARSAILRKLEAHGRINTHIDQPLCDDDGSYAKYQIEKKSVYCVWKDSKKIDNYQSEAVNIHLMNCNCARDLRTYADENLVMLMTCQGNGNYENLQMSNGRPYCVDADGFATTELCDPGAKLKCPIKV